MNKCFICNKQNNLVGPFIGFIVAEKQNKTEVKKLSYREYLYIHKTDVSNTGSFKFYICKLCVKKNIIIDFTLMILSFIVGTISLYFLNLYFSIWSFAIFSIIGGLALCSYYYSFIIIKDIVLNFKYKDYYVYKSVKKYGIRSPQYMYVLTNFSVWDDEDTPYKLDKKIKSRNHIKYYMEWLNTIHSKNNEY